IIEVRRGDGTGIMTDSTSQPNEVKPILATLLLERPAKVDCRQLAQRIGEPLEINLEVAKGHEPDFPILLPTAGGLIIGMRIDAPFPVSLDFLVPFTHWWRPNMMADIARNTCYVTVTCSWSKNSRLEAHVHHAILVSELADQLPVIGILCDHVL